MRKAGVIATGSDESASAGAAMLDEGGNAVDAAVAAAFATGAGDPSITSLAGGGVLIHRDVATGDVTVCDFFVDAPGLGGARGRGEGGKLPPVDFPSVELHFGVGATSQTFHIGRGSAAVPGMIRGLVAAHERWGVLPLSRVVAPAVGFLRRGVTLTDYRAMCFRILAPILGHTERGRRLCFDAAGKVLGPGAVFKNPGLADTLESLGSEGLAALEETTLVPLILAEFGEERGGWITEDDVRSWRPEFRPPLETVHAGAQVYTNPAPSVGGRFIATTLALLREAGVADVPDTSPERYRRLAAAFRAVSELRAEDPLVIERPEAPALFSRRLAEILDGGPEPGGRPERRLPGNTTHISVVDGDGTAAGVSVSHGEGCGHWIGETGLHMNNMLGEEDLFPGGFHRFAPGKRLSTMMAPVILAGPSGGVAVLGSGGSNRIRTVMAQAISSLLDDGLEPAEAVERGRLHLEGGRLSAEVYALPGGDRAIETARELAVETKVFDRPSLFFGGVHIARRDARGELSGAGDARRGGAVRVVP